MKRVLLLAAIVFVTAVQPGWAQQNELAALRAEVAKQQAAIQQLLQRIDALEKAQASTSTQALQDELKAQEDTVNSIRETINSKVNLNGYYNFRFSADDSETPIAFQQHHLGVPVLLQRRLVECRQQVEGNVGRLVIARIGARDVLAQRTEGGGAREGPRPGSRVRGAAGRPAGRP